jgi:ABC-type transporter Mla subunit MlaD
LTLIDLKQMLEKEKATSFELMDRVNELKLKNSTFNEQMSELHRELAQVRQLVGQESKQFQRTLFKLQADYSNKLNAFQRQESKFCELENRTKFLQVRLSNLIRLSN